MPQDRTGRKVIAMNHGNISDNGMLCDDTVYDDMICGLKLQRSGSGRVIRSSEKGGVPFLTFPLLSEIPGIVHGFSTRLGGVSTGDLASMNLSFSRGDDPERVRENYRRIADAIGFSVDDMVFSYQTHTNHVRVVTEADRGKGYVTDRDYKDVDGLVTNVPGLVLVTFYADCVPLFFVDPVHGAIGLSHSGWRGTVSDIAGVTVRAMQETYDSDPAELIAAIGPSICRSCYEVSEDVIVQVREQYPHEMWPLLYDTKTDGKYQLDLWEVCRRNMMRAGIRPEHIAVTDVCTCCNPDILYSHRASQGKRGNLAAFLCCSKSGGNSL